MFLHVEQAKYIQEYQIEIQFNDGRTGVADLKNALRGEIFTPLQNPALFSNFVVDKELATITWTNGADFAPEYLYFEAFKNEPELQEQFRKWGYAE
ncbi:MAG: DUF2442 domain-containing protein [Methylococcales bacterium]|nr:DUF2442 domain-containing protein [Methylococcales bacterium]